MLAPIMKGHWLGARQMRWFLRQRADAAFVATLRGWGGIGAGHVRQWPPGVRRTEHEVETEEPDRRTIVKRALGMTRAQNRGAQVRRELRLHAQPDAETAANRPGLEVRAPGRSKCFRASL